MDMDFLNSPTEAQMDLMAMMMQMEKLAEFSEPPPSIQVTGGPSPALYNSHAIPTSPTLVGIPSSISFGTTSQDPVFPHMFSNPTAGTSRTATELSFNYSSLGHKQTSMAAMREMIFRIAAMQPIHIDPETVKPPKRRNVKISKDPQSVAARHRRERISERIRILQRLVPGGTKMDTASMLDEAIHYVKFLKGQVQSLERAAANPSVGVGFSSGAGYSSGNYSCFAKTYQPTDQGLMNNTQMLT